MSEALPAAELVRAIQIYVEIAYPTGQAPANRRHFQNLAADLPKRDLLALAGVQPLPGGLCGDAHQQDGISLRIGNSSYPHMKMLARGCTEPPGFVLAVDTHDEFAGVPVPPNERAALQELRDYNHAVARRIVSAWEEAGLPTQATILQAYLKRRSVEAPA
jgi:hypothetical protein